MTDGVSDESSDRIIAELLALAADDAGSDICLFVDSPGGSVPAGASAGLGPAIAGLWSGAMASDEDEPAELPTVVAAPPGAPAAEPRSGRPRWWPLVAGGAVTVAVLWVFGTEWTGLSGSHPIGWITLIVVLIDSVGLMVWASVGAQPRRRRPWVTWAARAGLVVGTMLLVAVLVFVQPMSAERVALDATACDARVTVTDGATELRMAPAAPLRTGLASYPGARVDPRSYARVLRPVAEAGTRSSSTSSPSTSRSSPSVLGTR